MSPDHLRHGASALQQLLLQRGGRALGVTTTLQPPPPPLVLSSIIIPARAHATQASKSSAATAGSAAASVTASATPPQPGAAPTNRRSASSTAAAARRPSTDRAPPPDAARAALEYCARLVRQHDPDSFAWAMLLRKEDRARVLALRALNVETLLVPTSAVRRSAGEGAAAMLRIRYQWWRDAVRAAMDYAPLVGGGGGGDDADDVESDDDDDEEEEDGAASAAAAAGGGAAGGEQQRQKRRRQQAQTAGGSSARPAPTTPPPAHPVITALWAARASAGPRLQRYPLRRLIDAREREALSAAASEPPPLRLSDLEAHAEATHSQLLYAQLAAIGASGEKTNSSSISSSSSSSTSAADHAASHAGKAVGLAMALRGAPYAAAQRRCVLPLEVCASAGLSQEDLFRRAAAVEAGGGNKDGRGGGPSSAASSSWSPRADAALRDAVLAVASQAVAHLREARALAAASSGLTRDQAHALLPAVAADCYLGALERTAQFDIFHPALRPPPPPPPPQRQKGDGAAPPPPPLPPLGAGLGVSPLRYLLSLRWHAWRGTF